MGLRKHTYLRVLGGIAALLLFVSYIADISLFSHNHLIDGQTITHSHPYKGSPEYHTHTQSQLAAISMLSSYIALTEEYANSVEHQFQLTAVIENIVEQSVKTVSEHYTSFRAPPVF